MGYLLHFNRWKHWRKLVIFFPRQTICWFGTYWSASPITCSLSAWMVAIGWRAVQWSFLLAAEEWHTLMSLAVVSLPFVSPVSSPPSLYSDHLLLMWWEASTWLCSVQRQWIHWAACRSSDRHCWHRVMVWCHVVPNSASKNLWNYMHIQNHSLFSTPVVTFMHHVVSIEIPRAEQWRFSWAQRCWEVNAFTTTGGESQVFNLCEVVGRVIDTTWVVSVPDCTCLLSGTLTTQVVSLTHLVTTTLTTTPQRLNRWDSPPVSQNWRSSSGWEVKRLQLSPDSTLFEWLSQISLES